MGPAGTDPRAPRGRGRNCRLAAVQAKRKDTDAMARAIDAMRADADRNVMPLDGDRAFHTAMVQACGNVVLLETVQGFWDSRRGPLFERLGGYFETVDSWRAAITEHEAIHAAIRARDAARRALPCIPTWTNPIPDSARAGAARRNPVPEASNFHPPT
jgi:DNA-binding GntR family transcriptional regulator